jgi:hypothetical protein
MKWRTFCLLVFVLWPAMVATSFLLVQTVLKYHLFGFVQKPLFVKSLATADECDTRDPNYSSEMCIWQREHYPKEHPTCGGAYEAPCELHSVFDR